MSIRENKKEDDVKEDYRK